MDEDLPTNGIVAFTVESWLDPNPTPIRSLWEWNDPDEVPLRISISGVAGTGKTKLARGLATELDITFIDGIARTVNKLGGGINKSSNWTDEFMIFLAQYWEQLEYYDFVTAGSLIDFVAHAHWHAHRSGNDKDLMILRAITNVCNNLCNHDYSVFLYLPYDKKPRPDGVRSVDAKYLKEIDQLIVHYMHVFDVDYFPIQGSPDTKLNRAMSYLGEFGLLQG